MTDAPDFTHHFLIAMPSMRDARFVGSVAYVLEHDASGAMGLVVNKPMDLTIGTLLDRVAIKNDDPVWDKATVFFGGPVQSDRGFVLHRPSGNWHATLDVGEGVSCTTSKDILESISRPERSDRPDDVLITLGCAGWSPGQLEAEIRANAWLTVKAHPSVIFDEPPEKRHSAAIRLLGIDPIALSSFVGHA